MKKLLAVILVLVLTLSLSVPAFASYIHFHDSEEYPAVEAAASLGIVEGYQGYFRPLDTLTRAEFAQMIFNLTCEEKAINPRPVNREWWHVAEGWLFWTAVQPSYEKLDDATYAKLCLAYYDGDEAYEFNPNDAASFEWMILMLYLIRENNLGETITEDFADEAILWATEYGYGISATTWRNISSGRYVTRAEACALLVGLCVLPHGASGN